MILTLTTVAIAAFCVLMFYLVQRKRRRQELEPNSITPEALHDLLASNQEVLLYDVRQPLDLLADSEMIVGAIRIPPRDLLDNPSLIPKEKDSVVYCTCPDDKTSRAVLQRAQSMHLSRVRFLRGGLAGWKAKGYPVERYTTPFHLDTRR
jgi:rhodanese-related sulfurtransferase